MHLKTLVLDVPMLHFGQNEFLIYCGALMVWAFLNNKIGIFTQPEVVVTLE